MSTNDKLVERLARLDACAVSDACDGLGLPPSVSGIPRVSTDQRIAGPVITVRLSDQAPAAGSSKHLCTSAIEASSPGDIIVVEQRTGLDAGSWGGVLTNAAIAKGVRGVVCEGPVRDVEESRALGFPVFARSLTARTARGRVYEVEFNGEISVGDVTVRPNDLVIADASGIVFLPASRAAEIIGVAERIVEKERLMVEEARKGTPASSVMGRNYESMLDEVGGSLPAPPRENE